MPSPQAPTASAEAPCVSTGDHNCTTGEPIGKKEGKCYEDAGFGALGGLATGNGIAAAVGAAGGCVKALIDN